MKTLTDIEYLKDVRILLRMDFNVPIKDGKVVNDYRIRMGLPTIQVLQKAGAKVIIISHIEVKEGEVDTLKPVASSLQNLGIPVKFVDNVKNAAKEIAEMKSGEYILLENIRHSAGEKTNDSAFAKELASLADIYVNDAFAVSHREHASIVGVPKYIPSYAGLQFEKEVKELSRAFSPEHPFLFILGGAKFETKLPLLERFIRSADQIFVGGALAHDFFHDRGYELGKSLVSETNFDLTKYSASGRILLPVDVVLSDGRVVAPDTLSKADRIVDAGPKTLEILKTAIDSAKFILWNGPAGYYEGGLKNGTLEIAKMIASRSTGGIGDAVSEDAVTIIGGGDTLAAIAELSIENRFTFVSTAGGAMLDYLAKGSLPGIDALNDSKS
jgi:phosphoglycerate kinase